MKYKAAPGMILTSVCGLFFLVTPDETVEVNDTAAFCWKHFEEGCDLKTLAALAEEAFEISDREAMREDLRALTEALVKKGFLVRCRP